MTSWQWQYSLLYLLRLFTRPFSEEKKRLPKTLAVHGSNIQHNIHLAFDKSTTYHKNLFNHLLLTKNVILMYVEENC